LDERLLRVVIAGGGTSGHVLPGIAIAEMLEDRGVLAENIHFVGANRGIDESILKATKYHYTLLSVLGLRRSFGLQGARHNLAMLKKLLAARSQMKTFFRNWSPNVVVSVGGYASVPAMSAAKAAGISRVVVSYDSRPGLATRVQARSATVVTKATEDSGLKSAVLAGAPVRRQLRVLRRNDYRNEARQKLGFLETDFVVAVVGGSLGSGLLNDVVSELAEGTPHEQDALKNVLWYHIAGERFQNAIPPGPRHRVVGYESDMASVYCAADLVIARAGASTVAEITTLGVPSILIPWAGAADNHQEHNARGLLRSNATVMICEDDVTTERLRAEIARLATHPNDRDALARNAFALGALHREGKLGEVIGTVAMKDFRHEKNT
jgi:UDP-N-acetylglucosamine--N-acetylmuramyl-(pentapeptide) pyrophosphoryl-undecaprenol N-acetylglucosamine transferase